MIIWTSSVPTVNVQDESTSAAALYIYSIHNISTTDVPCHWKRKATEEIVTTAAEMFPKKNKYVALNKEPSDSDRNWLFEQLQGYGQFTGIHWLMAPEPDKQDQDLPVLERVLSSNEFRDARDKSVFLAKNDNEERTHFKNGRYNKRTKKMMLGTWYAEVALQQAILALCCRQKK